MATTTKQKPVTFVSKIGTLILGKEPARYRIITPAGEEIPGTDGERIEFKQGHFVTDDPELIEWLRKHPSYNRNRGFWEIGKAPDEPKPTIREQQQAIARAQVKGDPNAVEAVLKIERDTHNRQVILNAGEFALEAIAGVTGEEEPVDEPKAVAAKK